MIKFFKDFFCGWEKLPFKFKLSFLLGLMGLMLFLFGAILILLTGFRIYPTSHWTAGLPLLSGVILIGVNANILVKQTFCEKGG